MSIDDTLRHTKCVVEEIEAERRRQVLQEGWSTDHDDEHDKGELALAAGAYAKYAADVTWRDAIHPLTFRVRRSAWWPWSASWWKPGAVRRMLVKAAALLVAEIERLDRDERGGE